MKKIYNSHMRSYKCTHQHTFTIGSRRSKRNRCPSIFLMSALRIFSYRPQYTPIHLDRSLNWILHLLKSTERLTVCVGSVHSLVKLALYREANLDARKRVISPLILPHLIQRCICQTQDNRS